MRPDPLNPSIPSDTLQAARTMLGQNNYYLAVGDDWPRLIADLPAHAEADREAGKSLPPLSLSTIFQSKEELSDRQAEEATRLRVEWKYALHLTMHHPGFSQARLCTFRQQLYHYPGLQAEFQSILERFIAQGFFPERQGDPLTASTVLEEVCSRSRLEQVMLAFRRALEALAIHHPVWLRDNILPHLYTRYNLFTPAPGLPRGVAQQDRLAEQIGNDILYLLQAVANSLQPELGDYEEIQAARRIWSEQFQPTQDGSSLRLARCSYCGSFNTSAESSG